MQKIKMLYEKFHINNNVNILSLMLNIQQNNKRKTDNNDNNFYIIMF